MSRESRKVTFVGSEDTELAARLDSPSGRPQAFALFAHCFTCSKDALAAVRISRALTEFGLAVLRFDFTGLGHSGGDFANTTFSSNVEDLVHAAAHLRDHFAAPTLLIGHSLGGAAVLAASHRVPEVRAVATIGAPADPAHVGHLLGPARAEIERYGEAEVVLGGRGFRIRRQFLDDIAAQPQRDRIRRLDAALLVLHSPQDEVVGVENARTIFQAARHPKSFIALDGADHLLTNRADAQYAAAVLAAWASRYVTGVPAGPSAPVSDAPVSDATGASQNDATGSSRNTEPSQRSVVVAETGAGRFTQRISVRAHHVLAADEPEPVGTDTGPSPYELLLAALGACTSMTVRMYAERKGWPLERVTVALRHSRIHAEDCAQCETSSGLLDRIERTLRWEGELDEDQRRRLREIADRCPVHRTLRSEVLIETTEELGTGSDR